MINSKTSTSLGFWISVICTTLAAIPFELQSKNAAAISTIIPFFLMFFLFFYSKAFVGGIISAKSALVAVFVSIMLIISNLRAPGNYALADSILAPSIIILAGFARINPRTLLVIDKVIAINLFFFATQIFIYLVSNEIVEFHSLLFPFSSTRVVEFLGIIRFSGLYNEPGTYSAFMFSLLAARYLLGAQPTDKIFYLTGFSLMVTFSAWGMVAGSIVIMVALFHNIPIRPYVVIFMVAMALLVIVTLPIEYFDFIKSYIEYRFDTSHGSASYRMESFQFFIKEFPTYMLIGRPFSEQFCPQCISPQDLGVFSQLIIRLGLPAGLVILFFSLRAYLFNSFFGLVLLLIFFTGKYDLGDPIFWFVLGISLSPLFKSSAHFSKERYAK